MPGVRCGLRFAVVVLLACSSRLVLAQRPPAAEDRAPQARGPAQGEPRARTDGGRPANDGQRGNEAPRQGAAAPAKQPPKPPWVLSAAEEAFLDKVLVKWEESSKTIQTFKCAFDRWDFDKVNGPASDRYLFATAEGELKYKEPDHGDYVVTKVLQFVPPAGPPPDPKKPVPVKYAAAPNAEERWVCTGKSLYQFDFPAKVLRQVQLPPQMQGAAIADGPIPFVFGAKAEKVKKRYWLKDITPPEKAKDEIWLMARPRWQQDAANFQEVWVILAVNDFLPHAVQVFLPGGQQWKVYQFKNMKLNSAWEKFKGEFAEPSTPRGWKLVVEKPDEKPQDGKVPAANQARKVLSPFKQK